jgi:hypothetical protein
VRPPLLLSATLGLALAAGAAAEPPRTVDILRLDHRGGFSRPRTTSEPALEIRSDGTLRAPDLVGTSPPFVAKVPAEEVAALFDFVVREQRFFDLDAAKIEAEVRATRKPDDPVLSLVDASGTVVEAEVAGRRHAVSLGAPPGVLADLHPTVASLARLRAVVDRLENVHAVARAGGTKAAEALVGRGNAALTAEAPKAAPFRLSDLRFLGIGPDGTSTYRTSRREPPSTPTVKVRATTTIHLRVPRAGEVEASVYRAPES